MKYKLNLHFVSILTFSRDSKSQMVKQKHHSHGRTHGIKWLGIDEFRKLVVPNGWTVPFVCLGFLSLFFISSRKERCLRKMLCLIVLSSMMAKKASLSSLWMKRANWIDKRKLECSLSLNFL